jgi:hypothetical protein
MEHPRFVRHIHRFFNPIRHATLRDHEAQRPPENPLRKSAPGDAMSQWEARRAELENPNAVSYAKVYAMLALTLAAVATVLLFVILR